MTVYLTSLVFVVLAEMGDKTQLLAMAFASRYRWQTVLWGVLLATLANHLLAVLLGNFLTESYPPQDHSNHRFRFFYPLWTLDLAGG